MDSAEFFGVNEMADGEFNPDLVRAQLLEALNSEATRKTEKAPLALPPGFVSAREIGPPPDEIETDFIIDGIAERYKRTLIHGYEGTGKTAMAIRLAGDMKIPGRVIFIVAERWTTAMRRSWAWQVHNPDTADDFLDNVIFLNARELEKHGNTLFRLQEQSCRDMLLNSFDKIGDIKLIIVDGLAMALGGDVDSAQTAIAANWNIDRIMDETGAAWIDMHHDNKAGIFHGSQYHANLPGYRFEITGRSNEPVHHMLCRKSDSAEYGPSFEYEISGVEHNGKIPPGFAVVSRMRLLGRDEIDQAETSSKIMRIIDFVKAGPDSTRSRDEIKQFAMDELGYRHSSAANLLADSKLGTQLKAAGLKIGKDTVSATTTT